MKRKLKGIILDYIFINIGLIITAIGIRVFLVPGKVAAGGISGIGTILHYTMGAPVGLVMLILNIPIFLFGLKIFGKIYGFKTFYGTIVLSIYVDLVNFLFPNLDLIIDYSKGGNIFLAPLFGGIITGVGMGIVMKFGGSTGGTDILGQILNKFTHIPIGYAIMIIDLFVIASASIVFGLESGLYAFLAVYIAGIFINKVLYGVNYTRLVYIISEEYEKIREVILVDLNRGGTGITATGLYTNESKKMIMTVLPSKEIHNLTAFIKEIDKNAFVIITEAHEVIGEGFTPIHK